MIMIENDYAKATDDVVGLLHRTTAITTTNMATIIALISFYPIQQNCRQAKKFI
jgi:hypothetical protein